MVPDNKNERGEKSQIKMVSFWLVILEKLHSLKARLQKQNKQSRYYIKDHIIRKTSKNKAWLCSKEYLLSI